ncbi:YraN family protein [Sphingosinicella microcystinivorans]|uniref:UPF0102 protein DFR51_0499 n=1 Tax=Sphingosinicella microcystinivorans TaxID=335406 RepID=A0AAD1D521_SPHMI|nr:YraN family protein [Sphingosinicella microcystinivorans]RKS90955.1 putative endonuclease [Sphingosinicella microcystinivorans]BBE33875.1 UPF0102 protein [Sphingosinicella microcystinivorans]
MKRQAAERRGRRAERIAALWLRVKGYRILGERVRTPAGEIDIVARRGRMLVFVEVKARDDETDASAALEPARLRRVARAANLALGRYMADCEGARIDALVISRGRLPRHIEGVVDGDWA